MAINTRLSYLQLGTGVSGTELSGNVLNIKAPTKLTPSDEFLVNASRNPTTGKMQIQMVGRTQHTMSMTFAKLTNHEWWEINRFMQVANYVFYVKYLNHNDGKIKIQRFYRGNMTQPTPSTTTEVINGETVPTHYLNCGYNLIDMGDTISEVKTL